MRSLVLGLAVFALGLVTAALVTSPRAGAHIAAGSLSASVGPGFTIGMSASTVAPGDYTITVDDKSSLHNFHLSGPGVDKSTSISGTGSTSWSVTLTAGTYHFQCDAHASTMNGDLTVADTTTSTTTTTTASTTTATTTTVHTTTAHTTTQETTTAETTTEAVTTTAPATTTVPAATQQTPPPAPVSARIAAAHATRAVVSVTVASSAAGHAVADLLAGLRRLAHAAGPVPGTLRLRPAHPLKPGRYVVRLRVTARGATIASQRVVRVG